MQTKRAKARVKGSIGRALLVAALSVPAACSGPPACNDESSIKALEELCSPHAILLPTVEPFGSGSFSEFRDITAEVEDVPDRTRVCEVEVLDVGGRVIRSQYQVSKDGIVAGDSEVIRRFTPPQP